MGIIKFVLIVPQTISNSLSLRVVEILVLSRGGPWRSQERNEVTEIYLFIS